MARRERERILAALRAHQWRRRDAAAELNIDRTTLWRKMKKYGIEYDLASDYLAYRHVGNAFHRGFP